MLKAALENYKENKAYIYLSLTLSTEGNVLSALNIWINPTLNEFFKSPKFQSYSYNKQQ